MLVIQHRANGLLRHWSNTAPAVGIAEVDVHIDMYGEILVKHNPNEPGYKLSYFLKYSKHEKFFVDIKQNLPVPLLLKIMRAFDKRSIGLFDVPMPSAYFLAKEGVNFYSRLSEYERPEGLTNRYWLDPLETWDFKTYKHLIHSLQDTDRTIIACPSLHGQPLSVCQRLWKWIKVEVQIGGHDRIEGIVTKHVEECEKVLNA